MRILHLASEYPPAKVYGLGRFVHGLARAQAAQGDEVSVLTNSRGGAEDDVLRDGVRVHRIEFPNPPQPPDGQGEVLQFNHGAIARVLERPGRFRDVDLVAGHDWLTAIAAREVAAALDVPLVVTVHDEVIGKRFGVLGPDDRVVRDLEALTTHDATHVIANSAYVREQVLAHYGLAPARVTAVPGGIDPALLALAAPERVPAFRSVLAEPGEVLILYVGRLDPEKGLETLAEAALRTAGQSPAARFAFAGSGALEETLAQRLAPLGRRASLLGYVRGEALSYLYRAADVVVVPSSYEPFGLVALEAMLGEAAVVASRAGGLREIVEDGESGLSVPAGDAAALSDALGRLVGDPALRARLSAAGAQRARTEFAWSTIARRTRAVYERALAAPRHELCAAAPPAPARPKVSLLLLDDPARPAREQAAWVRAVAARTRHPDLEFVLVTACEASGAPSTRDPSPFEELRTEGLDVRAAPVGDAAPRSLAHALGAAVQAARGELVCVLGQATEVPPGREGWLEGLLWLLADQDAATVSPVTPCRGGVHPRPASSVPIETGSSLGGPQRVPQNPLSCLLARRSDLLEACPLVGAANGATDAETVAEALAEALCARLAAATGRDHWRHPVRLERRGHRRGPTAPQPAAPRQAPASPSAPAPLASIVMVAYDGLELTRAALDAVARNTRVPHELILVDNGSSDGTREQFLALAERTGDGQPPVHVIRNAENLGYPIAANQGARAASAPDVVLLNNDTRVEPGWLAALLDASRSAERVGLVAPKILNLDGSVQNAGGIVHHPDGSFTIPHAGEDRLAPSVSRRRQAQSVAGPCLLLTRALIEEVGLFDEAYSPGYYEDSDLCLRAREAGFRLVYEPRAEVLHHAKATSGLLVREGKLDLRRTLNVNQRRFYARWRERLEADERDRARDAAAARLEPRRLLLCYGQSETTTAAYCEAALRRGHTVVTAGPGQDLDLGEEASAADLVAAAGGQVDLLLAIEGENYVPTRLDEAPCPTAWWAIDTHLHAAREDGWHFQFAPRFDHVFVAQRDALEAFRRRGVGAHWLPLACAPALHEGAEAPERDLDLVFVGHVRPFHGRRRRLLDRLHTRFVVKEAQGVYGRDMARLLGRAKLVFNCSLAGDLNMRVFEGLASGGLLVSDRIGNGLQTFFADGEHLALYDDETLERVVARWLAHPDQARAVARRGQRLALAHHTYAARMDVLLRLASAPTPRLALVPGARS